MIFQLNQVLEYHNKTIEAHGGSMGVRDFGSLDAALNRHLQTFGGEDLYITAFEKAAAIIESVILNHPFVDGNKRTAYLLCQAFLRNEGYSINASLELKYQFVIDISTGSLAFDRIVTWLQQNTGPFQP